MPKLFFLLTIFLPIICFGQTIDVSTYQQQYQLPIFEKQSLIKIDGNFDEAAWNVKDVATNFWMKFPKDDYHPTSQTEVKMCYDATTIYFAIKVNDVKPLIGTSLKRDSRIRENDGVSIVLDPINKKTNGYYFSVTAYNVQADDMMSAGDDDLTYSWDAKWYSATKQRDSFYTIEIAIPLKVIRYDVHNLTWGVNFIRSHKKANEFHTWTRIPVNFRGTNIGYLGAIKWNKPPPAVGKNIIAIPYINQSFTENKAANTSIAGKFNAGLDAKIAITNSLNADITINPDFSQVEVDRQVTNLSRFSIFFPERRMFFLENSDLYSDYGIPPIRPFYSRTIGIDPTGNPVPIVAGVRITGNVAAKTRVGLFSMQTKATNNYAAQNYAAASVQQQLLKRSVWKAYVLNRSGFFTEKNKLAKPIDAYSRNAGTEFSYQSQDGSIGAWASMHHSIKPTITNKNNYIQYGAEYTKRTFSVLLNIDHVGTNYYTDMGFVERIASYYGNTDSLIRNGFNQAYNEITYRIFPKKNKKINQHNFRINNFFVTNPNYSFNEFNNTIGYTINFKNSSNVHIDQNITSVKLLIPTRFTDGLPLAADNYTYAQTRLSYDSDNRKNFVYGVSITTGKFYNGNYQKLLGKIIFRKQPKFTLQIDAEYNRLTLPQPYTSENLLLIAPRIEINFSNSIFWTTFIQYNTQRNNLNFNSRLQWRYKPASDLFLVYTDNYFTDPLFKNKNRAFVLKANYWLNL